MVERKTYKYGGVAQLGEHLPCKQGVMGSNPIISTSPEARTGNLGEVHRKFKSTHEGGGSGTRFWPRKPGQATSGKLTGSSSPHTRGEAVETASSHGQQISDGVHRSKVL